MSNKSMVLVSLYQAKQQSVGAVGMPEFQKVETFLYIQEVINRIRSSLRADSMFDHKELITLEQCRKCWHIALNNREEMAKRIDLQGSREQRNNKLEMICNNFKQMRYGMQYFSYEGVSWDDLFTDEEANAYNKESKEEGAKQIDNAYEKEIKTVTVKKTKKVDESK